MTYDLQRALYKRNKSLNLDAYCRLSLDQRRELAIFGSDSQAFEDSEKALAAFPVIDVQVDYSVDGETEIAVGDILTIKIQITNRSLEDG